jgi:PAS domain S-box-containing protein
MLHSYSQRLFVVAFSILIGMFLFEGLKLLLPSDLPPWLATFVGFLTVLLAAGIGLWIDASHSLMNPRDEYSPGINQPDQSSGQAPESRLLEAELFQLNQELLSQSKEQTNELARLNVELQLQMAMHQKAVEIAHSNEERFRNMADNIQEGLTILENGRLIYLNKRACEIFGDCPEGDMLSRIQTFAAPEERHRLEQMIQAAQSSGDFPQELEYWIVSKSGVRRCIRERYSTSQTDEITRTFIVTSDITQPVQAYQTLENAVSDRTRELSTLLDISRRIASTLELEPLLNLILDQIQTVIPFSYAAIFTLENNLLNVAAYQGLQMPYQDLSLHLSLQAAGPYRQVVSDKKVMIIDDIKEDMPLLRAVRESATNLYFPSYEYSHSWIGIPLIARDQVTGLLSLTHTEPNFYTQKHARVATTIANQVAVAIENARLYEKSQNLAVIEERNRIARELHDSVTQLLYGICLYCTATSRAIRGGNLAQVEENLAEIKEDALQALQEMRLLILELNPPMLQKEGLVAALQASLEAIETRTGLETRLETDGIHRLPRAVEAQLYRIAMEALNNLVRYAQAKKVTVNLRSGDDWIWMEIRDDGVGFDVAKARSSSGMGLQSMEQRARQLKGHLEVISSPGSGTRILVEAPVHGYVAGPATH